MRTTVDIPDRLYRELRAEALQKRSTIKDVILDKLRLDPPGREGLEEELPLIRAKRPGRLKLGKEGVYEYIPFP